MTRYVALWRCAWEHKCAQNGNGKSTRDNGDGSGYFFPMCAKIPAGRLDANAIQQNVVTAHLFFGNGNE